MFLDDRAIADKVWADVVSSTGPLPTLDAGVRIVACEAGIFNSSVAVKLGVLTHQPPVYIVQMLPTIFLPLNQTTICNHSASCLL